jgi:formylglycine-generating enzyme required for sulfatase activity
MVSKNRRKKPVDQIFISYSRKDAEKVDDLITRLEADGYSVWVDREGIRGGDQWRQKIVKAIDNCQTFLCVLTPNSVISNNVRKELDIAEESKIPIIPVLLQDIVLPTDMRYQLAGLQKLDLSKDFDSGFVQLVQSLMEKGLKPSQSASVPQVPTKKLISAQPLGNRKNIAFLALAGILIVAVVGFRALINPQVDPETIKPTTGMVLTPIASLENPITPTVESKTPTTQPTASPMAVIGSTKTSPIDGMLLVYVPEGEFEMGSSRDGARAEEKPAHMVYLSAYWIDSIEVTNEMYAKCVNAGICSRPLSSGSNTRDRYFEQSNYKDYPVIWVRWEDAFTYCSWADRRLPTDAEWEKAARANNDWLYPWGNSIDCTRANYHSCNVDTTRVGSYPEGKSSYGVLDMAGNVWEWVSDWWDGYYYRSSPYQNPTGPLTGNSHSIRGGSWSNTPSNLTVTIRPNDNSHRDNLGFRCALSP